MALIFTDNLGLDKPDRYSDELETSYARALDKIASALAGFATVASGDATYTLDEGDATLPGESRTLTLKLTSTLTAPRTIKIPIDSGTYRNRMFIIWNATAGGFKVTIKTTAGGSPTGVDITNGFARIVFHDGTNVYAAGPELSPTTGIIAPTGMPSVAARVYNSAVQSIADTALVALTFDSERYDTDTIHSTSSNTDRLTCKTPGLYSIIANVYFASNAIGGRSAVLELNGAATYIANTNITALGGGSPTRIQVATHYQLGLNDYVRVLAFQTSGGALNTDTANGGHEFMMARLGS
jgi:hypothetical protein